MSELSLLGPSKTKVLRILRRGETTASRVASNLHMQVSAARKHLEQLASSGLVAEAFQRTGVGRPKKFYTITEKGREIFPRQYHTLLNNVVAKLVEREGPDGAESIMRDIAKDVAKTLGRENITSSSHTKQVLAGINQLGFDATLGMNNGTLAVTSRNCPVWKAAVAQREVVCRGFHAELLRASLGGKDVDRQEWMVDGDSYCRHTISHEPSLLSRNPVSKVEST